MRFALLYKDNGGDPHCLVVNDTTDSQLPAGASEVISTHGEDYDGKVAFVVALGDDASSDSDIMDDDGNEVGKQFVDL